MDIVGHLFVILVSALVILVVILPVSSKYAEQGEDCAYCMQFTPVP